MKKTLLPLLLLFTGLCLESQNREVDSLYRVLAVEPSDTGKILLQCKLGRAYQASKPDSALLLAQTAYLKAKTLHYIKGQSWAVNEMATAFNNLGNFPRALDNYLIYLKIEEKRGLPENIAIAYMDIALLYHDIKDYPKAILYGRKADSIVNVNHFDQLATYSLLNLGEIFEKNNQLDSALFFTDNAYIKSLVAKNDLLTGTALNNLGNIYLKTGDYSSAKENYLKCFPYLKIANDNNIYSEALLGLGKLFEKSGNLDSALYYGKESYRIASSYQFLPKALNAVVFLSQIYKKENKIDSAFAYQENMIGLRDSLESREKIKDIQNITIQEQLRQKELASLREEEIKDRREKLQLLAIGISIPVFFLLSIVISRKKVHKKLIEFSGIISILLLFEYITLLLHPFIANLTDHSPFIEIIIFVGIAAIITPTHHRIEHWLIQQLTHFNYLRHHPAGGTENKNINMATEG
jgi:tetratricopeptide (TPR) repeat protein